MESVSIRLGHIKPTGEVRGTDAEMKVLKESLRDVGLIHAIVLNSAKEIIAGRRRYEAARQLGWTHIRAFVNPNFDDAIKALHAERDENCPGCRVDLNRKQQLERANRLELLENPAAAARKAAAQAKKGEKVGQHKGGGKLPAPSGKGDTRDKIGAIIGISGRTLDKAQAVINAAQEHPDRYTDLADLINTDKHPIDPVHEEFKVREEIYKAADSDSRFADVAETLTETRDTDAARQEYERRRDEQSKDKLGTPLPKRLVKVFNEPWMQDGADALLAARNAMKEWMRTAFAKCSRCEHLGQGWYESVVELHESLLDKHGDLIEAMPYAVCPNCSGDGCRSCRQTGWLPKHLYVQLKKPKQPAPN